MYFVKWCQIVAIPSGADNLFFSTALQYSQADGFCGSSPDEAWSSQDTHLNNQPILGPSCPFSILAYFFKRLLESIIHKFDFLADFVSRVFLLLSNAAVKKQRKKYMSCNLLE